MCAAAPPEAGDYNQPQLGLAGNASLLQQLQWLKDKDAMKAFVREQVPALMRPVGAGGRAAGAPSGAGEQEV